MTKLRLDITQTDYELCHMVHLGEEKVYGCFDMLNTVSRATHILDFVEGIVDDQQWNDSHDKTHARIFLAACIWIRVFTNTDMEGQMKRQALRRLERYTERGLGELRLHTELPKFFARYRSGHWEQGRSGPPSSRRSRQPPDSNPSAPATNCEALAAMVCATSATAANDSTVPPPPPEAQ